MATIPQLETAALLAAYAAAQAKLEDIDGVIVPDGYRLESRERLMSAPHRMRGGYTTSEVAPFCDYVRTRGQADSTVVFVDRDTFAAHAILDHGSSVSPEWGDDRATLTLRPTPEYAALQTLLAGEPLTQDALIYWIADWSPALQFSSACPDHGAFDPMPTVAAIQALRKIETANLRHAAHEESDLSRARTTLESARISSTPPAAMRMLFRPYEELTETAVVVRLGYRPTDPPRVKPRAIGLQRATADWADEFAALIRAGIGTEIPVYLGTYQSKQPR